MSRVSSAAAVTLQSWTRTVSAKKQLSDTKSASTAVQCWFRSSRAKKHLKDAILAATILQCWSRSTMAKEELKKARRQAVEKERALNSTFNPLRIDIWIRRFFLLAALVALAGMIVRGPYSKPRAHIFDAAKNNTARVQGHAGTPETRLLTRVTGHITPVLTSKTVSKKEKKKREKNNLASAFADAFSEPFRHENLEYATKFSSSYI